MLSLQHFHYSHLFIRPYPTFNGQYNQHPHSPTSVFVGFGGACSASLRPSSSCDTKPVKTVISYYTVRWWYIFINTCICMNTSINMDVAACWLLTLPAQQQAVCGNTTPLSSCNTISHPSCPFWSQAAVVPKFPPYSSLNPLQAANPSSAGGSCPCHHLLVRLW